MYFPTIHFLIYLHYLAIKYFLQIMEINATVGGGTI